VRWAGAQRDVLGGDLEGHVDLGALSSLTHLYALGPLEGARGEVSIFAGVPSIARIDGGEVVTAATWHARACFLVWAQVPAWAERAVDAGVGSLDELERRATALAADAGLDLERPWPFRVRGTALRATLHVLDKRDGLPHDPERHEAAKVRRMLERVSIELVAFHSRHHHGIFTPKASNVHAHLWTGDGRISGHLDAIELLPGALLGVPAPGWRQ